MMMQAEFYPRAQDHYAGYGFAGAGGFAQAADRWAVAPGSGRARCRAAPSRPRALQPPPGGGRAAGSARA